MNDDEISILRCELGKFDEEIRKIGKTMDAILTRMEHVEKELKEYRRESDQVITSFEQIKPYLTNLQSALQTLAAVGGQPSRF